MPDSSNNGKKMEMLIDDLSSLERYIKELFTFLPIPICFVSSLGVILEFNPAFEEVSGYKLREVIGENIEVLFGSDLEELIKKALEEKSTEERDLFLQTKKGEEIPVTVFVRARRDEQGEPIGVFISVFDLTRIREAERKLERQVEELQKFKEMAIGRELKMVKLKEEIARLKEGPSSIESEEEAEEKNNGENSTF